MRFTCRWTALSGSLSQGHCPLWFPETPWVAIQGYHYFFIKSRHQRFALYPISKTLKIELRTPNPKLCTVNPKPQTLDTKHQIPHPHPNPNPKPPTAVRLRHPSGPHPRPRADRQGREFPPRRPAHGHERARSAGPTHQSRAKRRRPRRETHRVSTPPTQNTKPQTQIPYP